MDRPCAHCAGTAECDQICCTAFGNAVRGPEGGFTYVCMVCQGSGSESRSGTGRRTP